jgi:hypothetical protein
LKVAPESRAASGYFDRCEKVVIDMNDNYECVSVPRS